VKNSRMRARVLIPLLAIAAAVALGAMWSRRAPAVPVPTPAAPARALPLLERLPARPVRPGPTVTPGSVPGDWLAEFKTDFSKHSVPYEEVLSGGPPKDGIPPIDAPRFIAAADADAWLAGREPVIALEIGGEARAYPLQILTWHEIVNDTLGGRPVAVTFCPLCNTAIVFDRVVDGQVLDFGTTGRLRYSNLIMYDRPTETWWQQGDGRAIAGVRTGQKLAQLPAALVSWDAFKQRHPAGRVLSRETGNARRYGSNPYVGYDTSVNPFLYRGPAVDAALPAIERVLGLALNGDAVAFAFPALLTHRVVTDTVGGEPVVVMARTGAASALDEARIADGREAGMASAFSARLDGRVLSFTLRGDDVVDSETGSVWDAFGRAQRGPLAGRQLTELNAANHFWFSWSSFAPGTRVVKGL
jgi:hypothetical protein